MARADLLALTDDALATLTNRGIVKRAAKEIAAGKGPEITESDGTVTATFPDNITVTLPAGAPLEKGTCTCPAPGSCRHQVMLALAYRTATPDADERRVRRNLSDESAARPERWSPAEIADGELEERLGARIFAAACKAWRDGYRARVRRGDPATVELSSCTVRFLVPGELGYARVDAARGAREDAIALAVWAFRVADEQAPDATETDVQVGGRPASARTGSGIEPALPLLEELLTDGIANTGAAIATTTAQARRTLDGANLRWPVDLLDDLTDQLDAYRSRGAHYDPALAAAHVAELVARHRCASSDGSASLPAQVLGTEESAETPLRLLSLAGLGARIHGDDHRRTVEVYLAHHEAGVVLALRRHAEAGEDEALPSAAELGRRRAGGARLSALACGNVVTESAVRSANRTVRIAANRVARTTVSPSAGRWDDLPDGILVRDLDIESARLAALPPALVRARVVAESVRVIAVASVGEPRWSPGAQRLTATVHGAQGSAQLVATHNAAAPAAIDALAHALTGDVRFVAGHLRRQGGDLIIDPTAVVTGSEVVVPAFTETDGQALTSAPTPHPDPVTAAVDEAIELTAGLLHRGARHLPPSWPARATRTADRLHQAGLTTTSHAVRTLADTLRTNPTDLLPRWSDTHIRLLVTSEQL